MTSQANVAWPLCLTPTGGGRLRPAWGRSFIRAVMLALAAFTLFAPAAKADQPLWELGMGAGGLRLPHYRGSDQSHTLLLPVPYVVYRGRIFRATREGARAVLIDGDRLDFDISMSASVPTRSADNRARAGMPDLAPTLELGPNLNYTLARGASWKLDLRLPVRAVLALGSDSRDAGWTVQPVINIDWHVAGWEVGAQVGPMWGSRRHNAYFYGVQAQYANAQRPTYRADAGSGGWRMTAGASRRYGALWLGAFVRADSVAGAAFEDSPLIKRRQGLHLGLAASWVFAVSDQRVPDDR